MVVTGLREYHRALKDYDKAASKGLDLELIEAARIVRDSATQRFSTIDVRTASSFRPRVRGFGRVVVEQRLGRTTGLRPDFGSLQMRRGLLPAMAENQEKIIAAIDGMLSRAAYKEGF